MVPFSVESLPLLIHEVSSSSAPSGSEPLLGTLPVLVSAPVIRSCFWYWFCTPLNFWEFQVITLKWSAKHQGHFGAVWIIIAVVTDTLFCSFNPFHVWYSHYTSNTIAKLLWFATFILKYTYWQDWIQKYTPVFLYVYTCIVSYIIDVDYVFGKGGAKMKMQLLFTRLSITHSKLWGCVTLLVTEKV